MQADIAVSDMMADLQEAYPERREMLRRLMGVNLDWRMHQLSDGQRRRVQIFLQLLRPSRVLLLDEVTTDLDVITRADFLDFLKRESVTNGCTIVYATHIFDGLSEWYTHIAYVDNHTVVRRHAADNCEDFQARCRTGDTAPLLRTVEAWLRASKAKREAEAGHEILEPAEGETEPKMFGNGYVGGRVTTWDP